MKDLMNFSKYCVLIVFFLLTQNSFAGGPPQPCTIGAPSNQGTINAGDDCFSAPFLGTLDVPCACDGATITPTQVSGTTIGATAENPYLYTSACTGTGADQASPAADVWYSFDVTGNELNVDLTSTMTQTNVAFYTGNCSGLVALGCHQENSGNLSTSIQTITPGQTVYIQISGGNEFDTGDFTLVLSNDVSCDDCVLTDALTITPAPINGTYQAGQTVDFCYTISEYSQENTNWLHGVVPVFGAGWDLGSLSVTPATTCENTSAGVWSWWTGIPTPDGPQDGFFFDGDQILGPPNGDPTDNYGDDCGAGSPNGNDIAYWEFCWSITTIDCIEGADLSVDIYNYADGETGAWPDLSCTGDPNYQFSAILTCCPFPDTLTVAESCAGVCDGSATVTGMGASPWDYVWVDGLGNTIATENNVAGSSSQTMLCAGTYTVTVTDNNGCVQVVDVVVSAGNSGLIVNDLTPELCEDAAGSSQVSGVDLTINNSAIYGGMGATFTWYTDPGLTAPVANENSETVSNGEVFYVEVTAGGCSSTALVTYTINSLPVITPSNSGPICGNVPSFTLNETGGEATSWTWSPSGGATITNTTDQNPTVTGASNGEVFTVTGTDANNCVNSAQTTITIDPVPTISTVGTDPSVCNGTDGIVTVSGSSGNAVTITWSGTSGGTQAGVNLPYDITNLTSGTYDVTYVDDVTGCATTVSQTTLNNPGAPVINAVASIVSCADQTIDISTITGTNLVNPQFYSETGGPTGTGVIIPDLTTFTAYTDTIVYVYDENGTCSAEVQFNVTINTTPTLTVQDTTTCSPNTVDLTDVTYWSTDVGTISYFESDGITPLADATIAGAGDYVLEADNLGCVSTANVTVTVNTTPTLTVQDTTTCSPNTIDLTDVTYWSTDVGTISYFESDGTTPVADVTIAGAGIYVLEADNLGCVSTANVTVTVNTTPTLTVQDTTDCSPFTVDLTDVTYWSADVGTLSYFESDGTTPVADASAVIAGSYVIEADNLGCVSIANVIVSETVTPTITATDPPAVCEPSLVDITGAAVADAGSLTWYSDAGLTIQVPDPSQVGAGIYYVEADNSGCTSDDMITTTVNPIPQVPQAGVDSTYCAAWVVDPMTAANSSPQGTLSWYTDTLSSALGTGTMYTPDNNLGTVIYYVTETVNGCEGPSNMVTIVVQNCEIFIPTAITPNGDLNNDGWEIVDLDITYPNNTVRVYNRWGSLIFEHLSNNGVSPYNQNQWDGTYEGEALPVGSYYYVIEFNDPDKGVASGSVSIVLD